MNVYECAVKPKKKKGKEDRKKKWKPQMRKYPRSMRQRVNADPIYILSMDITWHHFESFEKDKSQESWLCW